MKKTQKGFTLIELMIVVAIIGILAAVAIPKFAQMLEKSREGATKGNVGAIKSAVSIYSGDWQGVWPSFLDATGAATAVAGGDTGATGAGWFSDGTKGAYMDLIPAVKVTGKNAYNTGTIYNPSLNGSVVTSGAFASPSITAQTTGWKYESATGAVWLNNSQFDSFGLSYTLFGYQ
jgi:prepilin-type N-terminal cleavage/methylation domain-containing protein